MKRSNNETLQYRESRIEGKRLTDIIIRFTRYRSINRFSDRSINRITRAWSPMNNSKIRHTQVSTHVRDSIFSNAEIYIGAFSNSRKRTRAVITWKFIYYIFFLVARYLSHVIRPSISRLDSRRSFISPRLLHHNHVETFTHILSQVASRNRGSYRSS